MQSLEAGWTLNPGYARIRLESRIDKWRTPSGESFYSVAGGATWSGTAGEALI